MNNSILHVDKCVFFTFAPPVIPLIYVPGHDLNSNASLNLDASLSLSPAMDVPGIAKLHVPSFPVYNPHFFPPI